MMLTEQQSKEMGDRLAAIELPLGIERKIAGRIMKKFDKAGLYYHPMMRIKNNDSIMHKFAIKDYNDEKRIQDKIGIKFIFCFVDDLKIAEKIINEVFEGGEWAKTKDSTDEFSATKINGVFSIPGDMIDEETRRKMADCFIDDTFEIQLKTMLFHGWHETDHDLRYKNIELWDLFPEMNRKLNRVLATLELCDDSVINVFEKLSYRSYQKIKDQAGENADYRVDPLILERTAQSHLRIRMKESFPLKYRADEHDTLDGFANRGNTEEIMRKHFQENFKKMFLKQCKDAEKAEAEAKVFSEKVLDRFLRVGFLKKII